MSIPKRYTIKDKQGIRHIFYKDRFDRCIHQKRINIKTSFSTEISQEKWDRIVEFFENKKFEPTDEELSAMFNAWATNQEFTPIT